MAEGDTAVVNVDNPTPPVPVKQLDTNTLKAGLQVVINILNVVGQLVPADNPLHTALNAITLALGNDYVLSFLVFLINSFQHTTPAPKDVQQAVQQYLQAVQSGAPVPVKYNPQ